MVKYLEAIKSKLNIYNTYYQGDERIVGCCSWPRKWSLHLGIAVTPLVIRRIMALYGRRQQTPTMSKIADISLIPV